MRSQLFVTILMVTIVNHWSETVASPLPSSMPRGLVCAFRQCFMNVPLDPLSPYYYDLFKKRWVYQTGKCLTTLDAHFFVPLSSPISQQPELILPPGGVSDSSTIDIELPALELHGRERLSPIPMSDDSFTKSEPEPINKGNNWILRQSFKYKFLWPSVSKYSNISHIAKMTTPYFLPLNMYRYSL